MPIWRYVAAGVTSGSYPIDLNAKADIKFAFAAKTHGTAESDWLGSGDSIASTSTIVTTGITVSGAVILSDSNTSATVRVVPSGLTEGAVARLTMRITTVNGLVDDHSINFLGREQ